MTKLDLAFHEKQLEIYKDPHRFKVVCCGRRFGKTRMASYIVIIKALAEPDQMIWLVSPKYSQTMIIWRMLRKYLPKDYVANIKEGELYIELVNGSTIWAKSADNPDALVGEGLDFLVMDEAARVKQDAWETALQPALIDRKGEAIFISTPKGKNWFYNLYLRGITQDESDYKSFNYTSWDNPTLDPSELEKRRLELPEDIYRQEIQAEFIEGGGEVFQGVNEIIGDTLRDPLKGHAYVIGVDLAKYKDFTVITVADIVTKQIVYFGRFNQVDWNYQKEKIKEIFLTYNEGVVYIDSTGVGDPIMEDLQRMDVIIVPYKFTIQSKYDLVKNLVIMIKSKGLTIPNVRVLLDELASYSFELLPSGIIRYGAPEGMHDDCVTSLMLTAWALSKNRTEVVGEIPLEKVDEMYAVSDYGADDDRYIDWDEEDFPVGRMALLRQTNR